MTGALLLLLLLLQVVKVKVLECEPEKERLLLSFRAVVEGDTADEITAAPRVEMEVGQVTSSTLTRPLLVVVYIVSGRSADAFIQRVLQYVHLSIYLCGYSKQGRLNTQAHLG